MANLRAWGSSQTAQAHGSLVLISHLLMFFGQSTSPGQAPCQFDKGTHPCPGAAWEERCVSICEQSPSHQTAQSPSVKLDIMLPTSQGCCVRISVFDGCESLSSGWSQFVLMRCPNTGMINQLDQHTKLWLPHFPMAPQKRHPQQCSGGAPRGWARLPGSLTQVLPPAQPAWPSSGRDGW